MPKAHTIRSTHTIAIVSQKGGVGKTTTTAALGVGLTRSGMKVLFIDLDPQMNLTQMLGASSQGLTVYDLLTMRKVKAQDAIQHTRYGDIIASSGRLAEDGLLVRTGKEYALAEAIGPIQRGYDAILIDCAPSLGILPIAALTAADGAIVPVKADRFSLDALNEFYDTYTVVRRYTNPNLSILGVLVTQFNSRATINKLVMQNLKEQAAALGVPVYHPPIRRTVALEESQYSPDIFQTRSNAAADYGAIVDQLIKQLQED